MTLQQLDGMAQRAQTLERVRELRQQVIRIRHMSDCNWGVDICMVDERHPGAAPVRRLFGTVFGERWQPLLLDTLLEQAEKHLVTELGLAGVEGV